MKFHIFVIVFCTVCATLCSVWCVEALRDGDTTVAVVQFILAAIQASYMFFHIASLLSRVGDYNAE